MAIRVHLTHLVEALEHHSTDTDFVLDPTTGLIDFRLRNQDRWLRADERDEEDDTEESDEAEDQCIVIAPIESGKLLRFRRMFAESLDEPDVRERLLDALDGKGAFRRFREQLDRFPDIQAQFEQARLEWIAAN